MSGSLLRFASFSMAVGLLFTTGCSEVQGRRKIQEGNRLYKDGQYKEAVAAFTEAERLVPNFWVLWLNKGYTCRQMVIPGGTTPESKEAAKCALAAFKRLKELKPDDPRGELLYVQTLFDSDEYETLSKMYGDRYQKNPRDLEAITGLIQVYSKWNKVDEAMEWYAKKAEIQANDPEAQYAMGVFIWQQLSQKGGGPDKAAHDPRPHPDRPKEKKPAPAFGYGDIISQQRVDMADKGIEYLKKAIELKPKYHEAMTYMNLLYRQKAMAYFDYPEDWQKAVDEAESWKRKSLEAQGKTPAPAKPPEGAAAAAGGTALAAVDAKAADKPAATAKGKGGKKNKGKAPRKKRRK